MVELFLEIDDIESSGWGTGDVLNPQLTIFSPFSVGKMKCANFQMRKKLRWVKEWCIPWRKNRVENVFGLCSLLLWCRSLLSTFLGTLCLRDTHKDRCVIFNQWLTLHDWLFRYYRLRIINCNVCWCAKRYGRKINNEGKTWNQRGLW